jgi:site-specific recombinase XerD
VDQLAGIPEEEIWLASRKSARTRRAYRNDVAHFMRTLNITSPDELRRVDHRAVMAWERLMREEQGSQASTVRRRLAALSSLFAHLVKFGTVESNPVRDVERPAVNRREGMTLAFSMHLLTIRCSVFVTGQFWQSACRSDSAARRLPA